MCTSPGSTARDSSPGSMITGRSGGVFARTAEAEKASTRQASGRKTDVLVGTRIILYGVVLYGVVAVAGSGRKHGATEETFVVTDCLRPRVDPEWRGGGNVVSADLQPGLAGAFCAVHGMVGGAHQRRDGR